LNKYIISCVLIITFFVGCQSIDYDSTNKTSNFSIDKKITEIEVVDWNTEELITNITDQDFIQKLINELGNATSISTANMDFAGPDYKLVFKDKDEVIYELGYYKSAKNLGVIGRYWDFKKDVFYGVTLRLP
jgi:hypothetical protein